MSTSTTSTTVDAQVQSFVADAVNSLGRGRQTKHISALAAKILDSDDTVAAIHSYGKETGTLKWVTGEWVSDLADKVDGLRTPDLSRSEMADVIRSFIQSGSKHLTKERRRGASEEQVTALLQILGLVSVVSDLPVDEAPAKAKKVKVDKGLFKRLTEFAKSKGFEG